MDQSSIAVTLLPESLQSCARQLKRKGQQILYFLHLDCNMFCEFAGFQMFAVSSCFV